MHTGCSLIRLMLLPLLFAQGLAMAAGYNIDDKGLLAHGYDVVSYFDGEPLPGKPGISYETGDYTLLFANEANRLRFQSEPERYTPRFGGYCAYGVRMGKKLDVDPFAYAIHDDRLYLLLDRSTRLIWDNDRDRNIGIAERLWPKISSYPDNTQTDSGQ